ncbi:MAG: hydantoinase/oxoprolinase family protein [Gammaproteobacteria bacterium]|nr:hydantoinase/oxoprolinase family protein [Gammaproteobacteria bacterium]
MDNQRTTQARPYLGVDVGGTFTDLAFYDESGELTCIKVASTPATPGLSTLQGVNELRRLSSCTDAAWSEMSHTHSNTVAVNCLIERTGAKLGLLVTAGFRDTLEIARMTIPEPARYDSRRPVPLVPRRRVAGVEERIDAEGRVVKPLDAESAIAAAARLGELGCEILVICFLHSYKNPAHEREARAAIERELPGLPVEISSDVWPQAREFERATLALVNAHIRPAVERQAKLLVGGMAERGVGTPARGSRSNGGMELLATMAERPVTALLSGPAAGVAGAAAAAADAGWTGANLMTLDVGGTSADIGVVRGGRPVLSAEERVADFPILVPTVAVSAIGAGGGSIIWTDPTGALKIGPKSTGADPGPACYGLKGGGVAAMTDAFLLAGLLNPQRLLGGRMKVHPDRARRALEAVGGQVGLSPEQVADGAIQVATAMLAAESTSVLARRDVDLSRYRMVAYGGAGPLVAALVAEAVYVNSVLIPPVPGTLSALGAAQADLEGDFVQPIYRGLDSLDAASLGGALEGIRSQTAGWLEREAVGLRVQHAVVEYSAEMRYEGQGFDVTVPIDEAWLAAGDSAAILAAFHDAHQRAFGHSHRGTPAWLQELRAHLTGRLPKPAPASLQSAEVGGDPSIRNIRLRGKEVEGRIFNREDIAADSRIAGPAIVEQMDTTTLVPDGWMLTLALNGALILERGAA